MYDLELEKAVKAIRERKADTVLIQLPDGLKPRAKEIKEKLEKEAMIYFWGGSCFGACDIPNFDADLLIQFGHSEWKDV